MRILTVRPPWSAAIIHSAKDVENRPRSIAGTYRGPVAIHAGKSFDADARFPDKTPLPADVYGTVGGLVRGAIIGVVDLVDVHHADWCWDGPGEYCSPWAQTDAYHLVLANPRPLSQPILFVGALGLRRLDDETIARIEAAIA